MTTPELPVVAYMTYAGMGDFRTTFDLPVTPHIAATAVPLTYHAAATAALKAAQERILELERDAARYRWLRDVSTATWRSLQQQWRMPRAACDAVLDRAMADCTAALPLKD